MMHNLGAVEAYRVALEAAHEWDDAASARIEALLEPLGKESVHAALIAANRLAYVAHRVSRKITAEEGEE